MSILKQFGEVVKSMGDNPERNYKVEIPDHPLAQKTSWANNKHGGKHKQKFSLGYNSDGTLLTTKLDFRRIIAGIFLVIFGGTFVYAGVTDKGVDIDWAPIIIGAIIVLAGLVAILAFFKNFGSITFDKGKGQWRQDECPEKNPPSELGENKDRDDMLCGFTKDIGAVQVLNEWVRTTKTRTDRDGNSYTVDDSHSSYELNLVFSDGSRKTLQDSRHFNLVANNAQLLAEYLGVPVWK